MKSKHPDISLESFGDLTMSVNSDSPKQEMDDSLNSHETDIDDKESTNIKEEFSEFDTQVDRRSHNEKNSEEAKMIELGSMVWHHPLPRKDMLLKGNIMEANGSHVGNATEEKTASQEGTEIMPQELPSDEKEKNSSFDQNNDVKIEDPDTKSNPSQDGMISPEASALFAGSSCKFSKCKEIKSHFHCHLCDFIAFKVLVSSLNLFLNSQNHVNVLQYQKDLYFNCVCIVLLF